MAHIIKFDDFRGVNPKDINGFLKQAVSLKDRLPKIESKKRIRDLRQFFHSKISEILIRSKLIDSKCFFCGLYVANLLSDIALKEPETWIVADHKIKGGVYDLQTGANVCFLICSLFIGRSNWRLMDYKYYEENGINLFYQFYQKSGMEIGFYMSIFYKEMTAVAKQCVK